MTLAGVDRQRREFHSKVQPYTNGSIVVRHRELAVTLMGFQSATQFLACSGAKPLTTILQHRCFIDAPRVCGYLPAVFLAGFIL
jgi:hypothetical protein